MKTRMWLRILNPLLLLTCLAGAQEGKVPSDSEAKPSRPEYDALFSDILNNLPKESRAKVDSVKIQDRAPEPAKESKPAAVSDAKKKALAEKRIQEMDGLSKDVKERVEKAITDLEQRKKERQMEFKVLE